MTSAQLPRGSEQIRLSSFCKANACVGVAATADGVAVVDTKNSARLTFTHAEWAAFVAGVKAGEFDLPRE